MSADNPHAFLTFGARHVDLTNPDLASISITDIAKSLSQQCRFTGHTRTHFSIAQHSVLVMKLVPKEFRLHALLHDAGKTYLGEPSYQVKSIPLVMQAYRDVESELRAIVYKRFGLGMTQTLECIDAIRVADLIMQATERRDLMPPDDSIWAKLHGVVPLPQRIQPQQANTAEHDFLHHFKNLTGSL